MERNDKIMKIAVFFPGIGYHCDKPLLYYSGKIAGQCQYELCRLAYSGLSKEMDKAFGQTFAQTEEALSQIDWNQYEDVLFVSKSIGTIVASAYAQKHEVNCRNIYYTPLAQMFSFAPQRGIVFHGTDDPWVETEIVRTGCREHHLPLHIIEGVNHSLEAKDDAMRNLGILTQVMELTQSYIVDGIPCTPLRVQE
ncbi:MAG: alpha/beta hydrolase [Eubacterium sp.]|nr:alpha/beta hydrolase [Eubacterium sp.]